MAADFHSCADLRSVATCLSEREQLQDDGMSGYEGSEKNRGDSGALLYRSRGSGTDHLSTARAYLGANDGAGGSEPWTVKGWPLTRERQTRILREWAVKQGLWIQAEALGEIQWGRMEHDLFKVVGGTGIRMGKITKGAGFGRHPFCEDLVSGMVSDWFQARPGSPLQYLERLELVNRRLFPGMNRLEGFSEMDGRFVIVTSQPFFAGRDSTHREILEWFSSRGFEPVCDGTWFCPDDGLAVFDAGRTNLVFSEGRPVPIDVIPMVAEGRFLSRLEEAVGRKL